MEPIVESIIKLPITVAYIASHLECDPTTTYVRENKEKDGEKAQILTMELQKKVTKSFYYDVTSSF